MPLRNVLIPIALIAASTAMAQTATDAVSLDSCRHMALRSNKQLLIRAEAEKAAHYTNREAFAAYLPAIDFAGGYTSNQKKLSQRAKKRSLVVKRLSCVRDKYRRDTQGIVHDESRR